jgi:hypothetical protein
MVSRRADPHHSRDPGELDAGRVPLRQPGQLDMRNSDSLRRVENAGSQYHATAGST